MVLLKGRRTLNKLSEGLFVHRLGCGTVLKYFLMDIVNYSYNIIKKSNPKYFRKWDRGFCSAPSSFSYKEIIYYVISYSMLREQFDSVIDRKDNIVGW